jgi:RNase P protein component
MLIPHHVKSDSQMRSVFQGKDFYHRHLWLDRRGNFNPTAEAGCSVEKQLDLRS